MSRSYQVVLLLVVSHFLTHSAFACEPIVPITIALYGGLATQALLTRLWWTMLVVVAVKIVLFWFFAPEAPRLLSALGIILGNIFSTCMGIAFIFFNTSAGLGVEIFPFSSVIINLIGIYFLSKRAFQRLGKIGGKKMAWAVNSRRWATYSCLAMISTWILYFFCVAFTPTHSTTFWGAAGYWFIKWLMLAIAAGVSLLLTSIWEEYGLSVVLRRSAPDQSYFEKVLWVNALTLGLVLVFVAIRTIPERLRNPWFTLPRDASKPFINP